MSFTSDEQVRVQLQAFRGQQGPVGATPQLSIGEVKTLEADESAYAQLSGTAAAPVLSLGLPRGATGKTDVQNLLHNADFTQLVAQAGIAQRHQGPVNEQAYHDCIRTILDEHGKASVDSDSDMMAVWNKMKEKKGIRG